MCECPDHLKEEEMYCHEILYHCSVNSDLLLPYHFSLNKVTDLVKMLASNEQPNIDCILGYEKESLESDVINMDTAINESMTLESQNDPNGSSSKEKVMTQTLLLGYLPDRETKVTPLSKHTISNILSIVLGAYASFSENAKFQISDMDLHLQDLIQVTGQSGEMKSSGDIEMYVIDS